MFHASQGIRVLKYYFWRFRPGTEEILLEGRCGIFDDGGNLRYKKARHHWQGRSGSGTGSAKNDELVSQTQRT